MLACVLCKVTSHHGAPDGLAHDILPFFVYMCVCGFICVCHSAHLKVRRTTSLFTLSETGILLAPPQSPVGVVGILAGLLSIWDSCLFVCFLSGFWEFKLWS